jgi:hypothetical protein
MSLPAQIINLNDGAADHDYDLVGYEIVNGVNRSVRRETTDADNLAKPKFLIISHQTVGLGLTQRVRSLVQLKKTHVNADGIRSEVICQTVFDIPVNLVAAAEAKKTVLELLDAFVTAGFTDSIINQET